MARRLGLNPDELTELVVTVLPAGRPAAGTTKPPAAAHVSWAGFRKLTDAELRQLLDEAPL